VGQLLSFLAILGGFAVILAAFGWLAMRMRGRGIGGGLMGPIDDIFHPSASRYRAEIQADENRGQPSASADDRPRN
jgi:hypothetical protein